MDRIEPARKPTAGLLANRYLLNDSLFSNELGTLYQARDTQAGRDSSDTQVLIHLFPSQALGYTTLKTVCERLQQRVRGVGHTLQPIMLPIIDCGWFGTDAFFVLEAPQSWSLKSLPVIQNTRLSSLHAKAIQITDELIKKDLVREGLHAQLFLVTPDGNLHLPGTTLSENLQSQQHRQQGLLHPGLLKPETSSVPWQAIGFALAGVAVAGGAGVYYQSASPEHHTPASQATSPFAPVQPATMNTITVQPAEAQSITQTDLDTALPATPTDDPFQSPSAAPIEPLITLSKLDTPDKLPLQPKDELAQQAAQVLAPPQEEDKLLLTSTETATTTDQPASTAAPHTDYPESSSAPDSPSKVMGSETTIAPTPEPEPEHVLTITTPPEKSAEPEPKPETVTEIELVAEAAEAAEPETKPETAQKSRLPATEPMAAAKAAPPPNKAERRTRTATAEERPAARPAPRQITPASPSPVPASPNIPVYGSTRVTPVPAQQITPVVWHSRPAPMTPVRVVPSPRPPAVVKPSPTPAQAQAVRPPAPVFTYGGPPIVTPPITHSTRPTSRPEAHPATSIPTRSPAPSTRPAAVAPRLPPPPEPSVSQDNDGEPELTANGMSSSELINRAYAAIQSGHLNEQPNVGATYFVRLLSRIDKGNPQILRLSRAVVYQYHQRARNTMANEDLEEAASLLWLAARLIKEFNLIQLNDSQQVLEHRLME